MAGSVTQTFEEAMTAGVEGNLKTIIALCNNPHWTSERRWRILSLAEQSLKDIQFYKSLNRTVAELDDEVAGATDD